MATNNSFHGTTKIEVLVMYKECMHNHAVATRGYVLDGCGLFQANGQNGTPEAMVCAACQCHRNFHRRVEVDLSQPQHNHISVQHGETTIHQQTSTGGAPAPALGGAIPDPVQHPQVQETSTGGAPAPVPDVQNTSRLLPDFGHDISSGGLSAFQTEISIASQLLHTTNTRMLSLNVYREKITKQVMFFG